MLVSVHFKCTQMDLQVDLFISFPFLIPFIGPKADVPPLAILALWERRHPVVPPSLEFDHLKTCYWGHKPWRGEKSFLKLTSHLLIGHRGSLRSKAVIMGKSCGSTSRALDEQLPNLLLFLVNRGNGRKVHAHSKENGDSSFRSFLLWNVRALYPLFRFTV